MREGWEIFSEGSLQEAPGLNTKCQCKANTTAFLLKALSILSVDPPVPVEKTGFTHRNM